MLLLVLVPFGTTAKIGTVLGKKVVVTRVEGAIETQLAGTANVEADFATRANINVSGVGNFNLAEIEGDLSVNLSGMGKVNIPMGKVPELRVDVSGMGQVYFGGEATNANLDVSGMGSITVAKCTGRLSKRKTGMGSINVYQEPARPAGGGGYSSY